MIPQGPNLLEVDLDGLLERGAVPVFAFSGPKKKEKGDKGKG
jgi:hypothetical protein